MSTTIEFTQVPSTIRKPDFYGELNLANSVSGLPANDQRVLLVGCKLAGGSQAVDTPVRILSSNDGEDLFGAGSELDLMIKAAFKASAYVEIWACAVTEPTGAEAEGTVTLSGTATADGVLRVYVGGQLVTVQVYEDDTASDVATALVAACGGELPATAAAVDAVVTFTARSKGVNGNSISLRSADTDAPGITATDGADKLASGTGNVDLTSLLAAIVPRLFHKIALSEASATPLGDLVEHCDNNADAVEQRGQQVIVAMTGTLSAATTLASDENGARGQVVLLHESESLPWEVAAAMATVRAFRCGADAAANLDGQVLEGLLPADEGEGLTRAEIETCLKNGVTPLEEVSGSKVAIVRSITTYVENADGDPDDTLLETATIDTMDYTRTAVRTAVRAEHQGKKITAQRPKQVRTTILQALQELEEAEILRDTADHVDQVVVQQNATDANRLDAVVPSDVVPGLHVVAARFDLYL